MDIQTAAAMIIGGLLFNWITEDWLAGMLLGFLLAKHVARQQELARITERLRALEGRLQTWQAPAAGEAPPQPVPAAPLTAQETAAAVPVRQERPVPGPMPLPAAAPARPDWEARAAAWVKAFFTEGNVVLRVGLLVLFCGVAFLLKYAAERNVIPLELRLLGVALGGLALLGFGWRQRQARRGFALLVQGGGIGIMYLTVFAAFKLYHLVPAVLAFGIMLGLVATSAALALLQDARSLALFGAAGGFLAPVLLSDGSGRHVALFSYYALLNSGILAIAWFRAWRSLNLLGFVFTLGIGAAWGLHSYQPQHFATAEPFLILFFLMFTAIGVLFAFRQPPNLRGYVDGTLVFGTPVACFSLQAGMVEAVPHGLAYSALAVSLFYVGLARLLWHKGNDRLRQGMRTLTEAFLALGVVFVTLAVPLALSGRWTAVTWAMEGAALIWVGRRQGRFLARSAGLLLQFGAGLFFLVEGGQRPGMPLPLLNGIYLGTAVISIAALFSSWLLRDTEPLRPCERRHHVLLFVWGCLWWFGGGFSEIDRLFSSRLEDAASLLFASLSCAVLTRTAARLDWKTAAWPGLVLPYAMCCHFAASGQRLLAAWLPAFLLLYDSLRQGRGLIPRHLLAVSHIVSFLLLTLLAASEGGTLAHRMSGGAGVWDLLAWGLIPAGMILLVHSRRLEACWPLSEHSQDYQGRASALLALLLLGWLLYGCLHSPGNARPLPYIPLLNPLELSQAAVLLLLVWQLLRRAAVLPKAVPAAVGAGLTFLWLNSALARAVHHAADVPFSLDALFALRLYQAAVSILWGLFALALMIIADRRQSRTLWFAGVLLIGATVLKLFLLDLAGSGTVERIVSFLSVGILVIAISWFSPLPPNKEGG